MYNQIYHYAFEFTDKEKPKAERLMHQDDSRTLYGFIAGFVAMVAVFLAQGPWAGEPHWIHAYCTYGAIPVGIIVGMWVRSRVPHWTYRKWMKRWHPVIEARRAARGWDTPPPRPPEAFLHYINRVWIELDRGGCTLIVFLFVFATFLVTVPIAEAVGWFEWVWMGMIPVAWPGCLFIGDALANAYARR